MTKDVEAGLWHRRYGHLGEANSQKQWKNEMVGMNATLLECAKQNPKNIVDCKWVFRIKRDDNDNIERYKACCQRIFAEEEL